MKNFGNKLENFFEIQARGSTIRTEIIGGLTTFFAMCYICVVNPITIGSGMPAEIYNSVYIATAIGAIIGTLMMAFWAKMPFAQAPGMGLNSFFWVVFMLPVLIQYGSVPLDAAAAAYSKGLALLLITGIIFLILTVTNARRAIIKALPDCLKKAIPAGIGLFIAFIGFKNAGIIQYNPYTLVQLGNIAIFDSGNLSTINSGGCYQDWYAIVPILIAFIGFLVIAVLSHHKIKGAVIIGVLSSTALYYLFNIGNSAAFEAFKSIQPLGKSFADWGKYGAFSSIYRGFGELFNFNGTEVFAGILTIFMWVITFGMVDLFDTIGTLQGTAAEAGMLDEEGLPVRLDQCLLSDAVANVTGSLMGTSPVTTYVESAAGVSAGARTGLAPLVVAACFLIAMFLSPFASMIPSQATAPALIWVGVLMLKNFKEVDMEDVSNAVPAFLTLIIMPLSYSISNGIAIGMISYSIIRACTGKFEKKDILVTVLGAIFLFRMLFVYM